VSDESIDESGGQDVSGAQGAHPLPDEDWWLDRPNSIALIIKLLVAAGVIVVLADLSYEKHGEFHFREWFGFDAVFGFAAYVFLIVTAKGWRKIVMRGEDYYD
jgi:hypothetical protein